MYIVDCFVVGIGGDNSKGAVEGVMTSTNPSDPADSAVQANIVVAG